MLAPRPEANMRLCWGRWWRLCLASAQQVCIAGGVLHQQRNIIEGDAVQALRGAQAAGSQDTGVQPALAGKLQAKAEICVVGQRCRMSRLQAWTRSGSRCLVASSPQAMPRAHCSSCCVVQGDIVQALA